MYTLTREQKGILRHPIGRHGRILAGPGTGKSTIVVMLAERLMDENESARVRVVTFTRAATAELNEKALANGHAMIQPTTVHSFALSILMRNPGLAPLPEPLRIPDDWEAKELIQSDIARRLRAQGFERLRRDDVARLEREMASKWESLDPNLQMLADVDPGLRNAYIAVWTNHRQVFGYSLFAELPLYALQLLQDHPDLEFGSVDLLIVDEYQDLNRCEISLAAALRSHGVRILAVGDDDQSIYSFRMAAPQGIREFTKEFPNVLEYRLSISHRCGKRILASARTLIESTPNRLPRPPLSPGRDNPTGVFEYLRFPNQDKECAGVTFLVRYLIQACQLRPSDIAVLVRGDYRSHWSSPVRRELSSCGIPAVNVEQALQPLQEPGSRKVLAVARLAENRRDDLAWWTILKLTSGVSDDFIRTLADAARDCRERFAVRLLRVPQEPLDNVTANSLNAALSEIARINRVLRKLDSTTVPESDNGWGDWILGVAELLSIQVSPEFSETVLAVGASTLPEDGLAHCLNQIEPITKDLALRQDGVAIMTMMRSKGLTFRAAIVMGVEDGVIPSPRASDEDEERRLLYVAMTRAREFTYLTMATRRTGPTARSGTPNPQRSRSRSPFFRAIGIEPKDGESYLRQLTQQHSE